MAGLFKKYPGYKKNFETLRKAFLSGDAALLACRDKKTGEPVAVLCAVDKASDMFEFIPIAKLFNGDPYEELDPPTIGKALTEGDNEIL